MTPPADDDEMTGCALTILLMAAATIFITAALTRLLARMFGL